MKQFILSVLAGFIAITAQSQVAIDLAEFRNVTKTIDVTIQPRLIIENLLPALPPECEYSVEINQEQKSIPALSTAAMALIAQGNAKDFPPCERETKFMERYNNLLKAKDETDVKKYVKELNQYINGQLDEECKEMARQLIGLTTKTVDFELPIKYNQVITVIIKKTCNDSAVRTWKYTLKTPEKTPWKVMFGFTFVPNKLSQVTNYYARQSDTSATTYIISKLNNQNEKFFENISPTLMFQWAPLKKYSHSWKAIFSNNFYQLGFTGGLSLNFANETSLANVMAGPSIVIADNMSLSAGVVFTGKNVLRGIYAPDETLAEQLTFDQLHEKKYMPEYFISIAFRFDQNPFKKSETPESKD